MVNTVTRKSHLSNLERSRKIVAFKELVKEEQTQRSASRLLNTPRSSIKNWQRSDDEREEIDVFLATPAGSGFLNRIVLAAHMVIQYKGRGIRCISEFLSLSGLGRYVAHSRGAIHSFSRRFEAALINIGEEERNRLTETMPKRKIVVAEDETFHKGRPCLVAIDMISNFILVEKYAAGRGRKEWDNALAFATKEMNVEIVSVTSDGAKGIKAHVEQELGVKHAPDILHVQLDISKGTAVPLRVEEEKFARRLQQVEVKLKKIEEKKGRERRKRKAKEHHSLTKHGYDLRKERRAKVQKAVNGIGKDFHPVHLQDGRMQDPKEVKRNIETHFEEIESAVREAELKSTSLKRVQKAKKQIDSLIDYLDFFFSK